MNAETFEKICQKIETTENGVFRICRENKVSSTDFYQTVNKSEENLLRYTRAKELQCEIVAEHIIDIADDSSQDAILVINPKTGEEKEIENREFVNRSRLKIDTRKWCLAKLKPKKYGDMVQQNIELNGKLNIADELSKARKRVDESN
jgi:hypothetical protein